MASANHASAVRVYTILGLKDDAQYRHCADLVHLPLLYTSLPNVVTPRHPLEDLQRLQPEGILIV